MAGREKSRGMQRSLLAILVLVAWCSVTVTAFASGVNDEDNAILHDPDTEEDFEEENVKNFDTSTDPPLQCPTFCKRSQHDRQWFDPGRRYEYEYYASSSVAVEGTTAGPRLILRATVHIDAITECQLRLNLSNAQLELESAGVSMGEPGEKRRPARASLLEGDLQRRALVFTFSNGRIEALCPAADEPLWALNVKRGLLSALQSSGRSVGKKEDMVYERDVTGLCPTSYKWTPRFGWYSYNTGEGSEPEYSFFRERACDQYSQAYLPLPSGAPATDFSPITRAVSCRQRFAGNFLREVNCVESQDLDIFSSRMNSEGATVEAPLTLEFKRMSNLPEGNVIDTSAPTGPRTSLQFEAEPVAEDEETEPVAGDAPALMALVQQLAAMTEDPSAPRGDEDAAALLRRLSVTLRRSDFSTLQKLFAQVESQPASRRLVLEVLPSARSQAAAALVTLLAADRRLKPEEVDAWLTSRALRVAPSDHELLAITPLVEAWSSRPRVLLAAGALVYSRCNAARSAAGGKYACARGSPAAAVVAMLEKPLGTRCHLAAGDEDSAFTALRALGNAGHFSKRIHSTLTHCYQNAQNPLPLRLAAVDALRRSPCADVNPQPLLRIFSSRRADTELRIASYLSSFRCSAAAAIRAAREVLRTEDLGQVTSFVWSHLGNIMKSHMTWKMDISHFMEDDFLKEKFNVESLKYSKNYRTSLDSVLHSAEVESNAIFSRDSYLPRSASVNLTVQLFRQPISLLEIGGRMEGFEKMLEDLFGPKGYYPDASLHKVLTSLKGKRDAVEMEQSLQRMRTAFGEATEKRLHPEPRADVFARIFGQEVAFASLHDAPQVVNNLREGNPIAAGLRALFADGTLDATKALLLDEAKYTFPTIVGFPVTLSLGASALLRVRAQGNWSTDGPPGSLRAEASLSPSAALAADASMMVGPVAGPRVGVRLRQRARVASHTGAAMEFQGVRLARLELRAPTRTLQLLDASSTLLLVEDGEEQPSRLEPHVQLKNESMCSGGTLERVLGLRACANFSYSSNKLLGFPLSGPAAVRLELNKTDDFDKYESQWELEANENGVRGLKVSFDTPRSSVDRLVRVEARADAVGPSFRLRVRSPAGGAEASASVARNDSAASADVRLAVDGAELLRVSAALRWERPEHGPDALRLRPELDAQAAGGTPLRLAGELGLMPGARYHAHVVLRGSGEPVKLQGELRLRDAGYEVLGEVSCPLLNGSLSGNVTVEPGVCASDLRVEYTTASGEQHSAAWSHSYEAGASSLALNASTELSEFPAASARLQWALRRELALWEHRLRWERAQHVWKAIQRLRTLRRGPRRHLHALAALTCPQRRIDYKFDLEHEMEEGNWSTRGEVLLGWKQRYAAAVQFSRAPGPRVELNAEASTPSVRAEVRGRIAKKKHFQGELEGVVILPRGRSHLALTGTYKQEGGGMGAGPPGAQVHQLQLQLVGALRGEMKAHVSLGADGVEHALRLKTGTIAADAPPSYAHFLNYHTHQGRHLVDAIISIGGQNFSGSVEAILNNEDESIIVRLPFSSQIIFSSKWRGSKIVSGEADQEYFDVEVSWDKHLFPNNYVSFNYSKNSSYSRRVLDYPNQSIFGEVVNKPGYLSLEMRWDKENKNRKIQSKANWNFEPNKGSVSAWINTPYRAVQKQSIDLSYSTDAEEFQLQMSAHALGERQQMNTTWRRDPSGEVRASLQADGTLSSPLQVTLEHEPRGRTFFSVTGVVADAQMNVSRSASDGSVSALSASSRVWPFPACSLDAAHADGERRGALQCEDALELSFRAADDRPFAAFRGALQRFGHARFNFNFVGNNKTAIFETGTTKQPRFFAVGLEHYQQSKTNFTLKLDTRWKERGLQGLFASSDGKEQTKYHGAISGDLDLQVTHVRHHLSQYPHDFLTLVSLPGKIRLNHTFQGKSLMNWMGQIDMKTPYREGLLKVEQAINPSSFYHQAVAETILIGQRNEGETVERRRVESLVRVDLDDDALLGVKMVEASLQPPGSADALSLSWTAARDEYVLAMKYPPRALALRVDTGHDDDAYFAKGILELPDTAPLEVKSLFKVDKEMFAEVKGRWGNQTLDIESRMFMLPGITTAYVHSRHSTYGEIVHFEFKQTTPSYREENVEALARYFGREMKLVAHNRNDEAFEEWRVNITTPFAKWKTMDGFFKFDMKPKIQAMFFQVRRNDEEMGLTIKSDLPTMNSITHMDYGFLRFWIKDDYVTALIDRRLQLIGDQKLEGKLSLGGKMAEFRGAVKSRRDGQIWTGGSIQALLKTWFKDLEHTEMLVNYTKSEKQELEIFLKQDEWVLKVDGSSKFDRMTSFASLNVLLPPSSPVRNITGKLNYQKQSLNDHQMVMSAVCDGQVLETNVSLAASDGELAAFLDTRNSLGYGPLTARFNLATNKLDTTKALLFELTAGQGQVTLTGWLSTPSILNVTGHLNAQYGSDDIVDAGFRYDLSGKDNGRRHAHFEVVLPASGALTLSAEVLSPEGCRCLNASMTLSAPRIGALRASAAYDAKEVGAVYANAEVVSGSGDDERRFLDVALSLRDSILSAQMVAEPLGLRVLSVSSGWADRDLRRYARLHVHVAGLRELRAEASAPHDLDACEVLLQLSDSATSDEMTTRLHAKYEDTGARRNVTAVLVRARDTRTLTASLERREGGPPTDTRAEVYLAATSLGRLHVVADVQKEKGSILELFIDDNNLDPVLHSRASLAKKKVDLFIESRRADFRKVNFSVEVDVYPTFNHTSFYLEHLAGRSYLPSTVAALLGRTGSFFKLDNNYVMEKYIPRNIELTIVHEKLFESPINPSYDLVLSLNRTEVLRSSANFVIDLEKGAEMSTKINSNIHGKKWKMGVEARYKSTLPASFELKVTDQTGAMFELTESHEFKGNGSFFYNASLTSHYGRQRHAAELQYDASALTRVIVDINSTVSVDTRRYYASLLHDPSRQVVLEVWTPIKGFEHFDLRAQREVDKLTFDLFASCPGLNLVSLRGEARFRNDIQERTEYTLPVESYPLCLNDLRNATLQLEVLREDGRGTILNGSFDVSGTKRTVRMNLSRADGDPLTISGYWDPFAEDSLNAGYEAFHPKHTSLCHLHFSSDKILFKTLYMNDTHNITDFQMLFNRLNNSPILQIDFRSSFMKHPLTVVYDYSTFKDGSGIQRDKFSVEVQAFGKPVTISSNFESDSSHFKYNIKSYVLDKAGNLEILYKNQEIEGRIKVEGPDGELLLTNIRSNTSMIRDGFVTFSLMQGKKLFWKSDYDFRGDHKQIESFVEKFGERVFHGKVTAKSVGEGRFEEITGRVVAPVVNLNQALFKYSWEKHDASNSLDESGREHVIHMLWRTASEETSAHMNIDITGRNKTLNINVQRNEKDIFVFLSNFYSLRDQNVKSKHLYILLNNMDSKWLLSGSLKRENDISVRNSIEIITPRHELQRVSLITETEGGFSLDFKSTIYNENSSLVLKYDEHSLTSTLKLPRKPIFYTVVDTVFDRTSNLGNISAFFQYGEESVLVIGHATVKDQEAFLKLNVDPSWMHDFSVIAENGVNGSNIKIIALDELIVGGEMIHSIDPHLDMNMIFTANIRNQPMHISARYSSEQDKGPLRLCNFEWRTTSSLLKWVFKFDDPLDDGHPEVDANFDFKLNKPIVSSTFKGVWPKSGEMRVLLGETEEEFKISCTLDQSEDSADGKFNMQTPYAEPLEITLSIEHDPNTKLQKVTVNTRGYGATVSWNLTNRKELIAEIVMPLKKNISVRGSFIDRQINLYASWPYDDTTATFIFILDLSADGSLILSTPWALDFMTTWKGGKNLRGEMVITMNSMRISALATSRGYTKNLNVTSPWYTVGMTLTKTQNGHSTFEGTVTNVPDGLPVALWRFEISRVATRLSLNVWDSAYRASLQEDSLDIFADNSFVRLEARTNFSSSGVLQEMFLNANSSLNRLEASWRNFDRSFNLDTEVPKLNINLRVSLELEDNQFLINYKSPSLEWRAEASDSPSKTLFRASAKATRFGSSRLEIERREGSLRLVVEVENAAGKRLGGRSSVNWGPRELQLEAAAGDWTADLKATSVPPSLQANWRNASLKVQIGEVRLVTLDGSEHTLFWTLEYTDVAGHGRLQVDSPAMLPEHVALQLDFKNLPRSEGLVAIILLEKGKQRHSVQLSFSPSSFEKMRMSAKVDDREVLSVGYALTWQKDLINASMHLSLRDQENSLELSHRREFPFASSVSARAPWLLRGERVSARVATDARALDAQVALGEGAARRDAVLQGRLLDASTTLAFQCSFEGCPVLLFTLDAALRGSLEDADATATADTLLLTSDGAALHAGASAALAPHSLGSNLTFVSQSQSTNSSYNVGFLLPLSLSEDAKMAAWLTNPTVNYTFNADLQNTNSSVRIAVSLQTPNISSTISVLTHRHPFSLDAAVTCSARQFHRYAMRLNTPVENGAGRAYAFEWGADPKRVDLRYRFVLGEAHIAAAVELLTPFRGMDRCALQVAYENGERKLALARVHYPGLDRDLGLELDYRVQGLTNASVRVAFHSPSDIPSFVPRLRSAELMLVHVLDASRDKEFTYRLELRGEVNGREADVALGVDVSAQDVRVRFDATQDDVDILRVRGAAQFLGLYDRQMCSVEVNSIAERLRHFKAVVDLSQSRMHILSQHNDVRYIELLATGHWSQQVNVTLINPLKSVFVSVTRRLGRDLELGLEVGLGRLDADGEPTFESVLSCGVQSMENFDGARVDWSAWAHTSGPGVRFESAWEEGPTAWERRMFVWWEASRKAVGYHMVMQRGGVDGAWKREVGAQVGERAVKLRARGSAYTQEAELLWDAARDEKERAAVALNAGTPDGWELKLEHPLLGDGARLALDAHLEAEGRELRAGATVALALLMKHGVNWRASAALQVVPRTSDPENDGGRAVVSLRLQDRVEGRDLCAELRAEMGREETMEIPNGAAVAFALNVTYVPGSSAAWRTLLSEIRASPRLLLLHTRTPEAEVTIRARSWDLGAELLARADQQDAFRLQVVAEPETRSMAAEVELRGGDRLRLQVAAPHRRLLVADVSRQIPYAGSAYPFVRVKASLRGPRLFQATAYWSTSTVWKEAVNSGQLLRREVERVPRAMRAAADAHARLWREQWDAKIPWPAPLEWRAFVSGRASDVAGDVKETMDELLETVSALGSMNVTLDDTGETARAFWEEVSFCTNALVKSIFQWGSAIASVVRDCLDVVADAVQADVLLSALGDALSHFRTQMLLARAAALERAVALLDSVGNALEDSAQMSVKAVDNVITKVVDPFTGYLWMSVDAMSHAYFELVTRVDELKLDIIEGLFNVTEISQLIHMKFEALRWFKGPFKYYLEEFVDYLLEVVELVLCDLEQSVRLLWEKVQRMAPDLPSALRNLCYQLLHFWKHSGASTLVLKMEDWRRLTELESEAPTIHYDTRYLLVRQHLPVDWEGFDSLPRFDQLRRHVLLKEDDGGDSSLSLRVYDLASQTPRALLERGVSHVLQSFSATAQLVGSSHVVTFDGNAYAVDADCSYLLSGDLVHNTFAIVVHFTSQSSSGRSFTIVTPEHYIFVSKDYVVRVDGMVMDLPARHLDLLDVHRTEDALQVTVPGAVFRCHVRSHVCTVHVSGWNFGHVAGLLGSFDRERADDLDAVPGMRVDGARGHHVWRVGRCKASNRLPSESPNIADMTVAPACKQMFVDSPSVLSVCHSAVDPSPYAALCSALGPCHASQAYSEACRLKTSVQIKVPLECGSCVGPDGDWLSTGGVAPSEGPQADVSLVVQRSCGRRGGLQRATDVASHLAAALAQRGVQNTRFAVVAFGGSEGAVLQAPAGRVWTDDPKALQKMTIRLQQSVVSSGGAVAPGEAEAAVGAASALRGRAGAGRAVVLVQCGVCARDAFAQLAAPLEAAGAPLHVLRPGALSAPSASRGKAARALGASGKGLAFSTPRYDAQTPEGLLAEKAIAQAVVAKDACTAAALESGGSVFDPARMTGAGQPSAKRFMDAWAEEVARSIRPSTCTRFRCATEGQAVCATQEISPQNSEEADEQFMQFLQ